MSKFYMENDEREGVVVTASDGQEYEIRRYLALNEPNEPRYGNDWVTLGYIQTDRTGGDKVPVKFNRREYEVTAYVDYRMSTGEYYLNKTRWSGWSPSLTESARPKAEASLESVMTPENFPAPDEEDIRKAVGNMMRSRVDQAMSDLGSSLMGDIRRYKYWTRPRATVIENAVRRRLDVHMRALDMSDLIGTTWDDMTDEDRGL